MDASPTPVRLALRVLFNGTAHDGVADPGKTILENIEAMRLPIRSACRKGRCGSCKVVVARGLHPRHHVTDGRHVLSCVSRLSADAEVVVSYSS